MGRKVRIHYPGALYHVMVRGNNGENVLLDEIHKSKYLGIVGRYKEKFAFNLYAFCIMDNHAHLLIEVQDVPLSQIMQRIQQVYTQWFNHKLDRTGHVFQQRYKAVLCNKESYLLQLIRYIHNNPVRVNMYGGIEYQWSSHVYYIGKEKGNLVDTSYVLGIFSEDKLEALKEYYQFMDQMLDGSKFDNFEENQPEMPKQTLNGKKNEADKRLSIDKIIEKVCFNEDVSIGDIRRRTKIQRISDIRKAIVLIGERHCIITNTMLAQKLNLPLSMISKIRSGTCKGTGYVEDVIRRWEEISE